MSGKREAKDAEQREMILQAVRNKVRPYQDSDICMAVHLSKSVVRRHLGALCDDKQLEEYWINERGPFYRLEIKGHNAP